MKEETTGMVLPNELVAAIVADECRGDERAAARLRADCGKAVNDLIGARMPDGVAVRVAENTPDTVHVVLPHYSGESFGSGDSVTLSEAELRHIAGGIEFMVIATLFVAGLSFSVITGALLVTGGIIGGVLGAEAKASERAARERSAQRAASAVKTVGGDVGLT